MNIMYQEYLNQVVPAPTQQYPNRQFTLHKQLGDGGEGAVFLALQKNGDPLVESVAFKLQPRLKEYEQQLLEVLINYQSKYETEYPQYIIKIYEIIPWNGLIAIIMETGTQNLFEYMNAHKADNLILKGDICKQLLKSLQFLHHIGYAHRDIKPENYILVGNQWKLCDFGLAKSHEGERLQTKQIGSIMFTAPEVLKGDQEAYTEKVDVWSLGCVFYEIIQGKELFNGQTQKEIEKAILNSNKQGYLQNEESYMQAKVKEMCISEPWKNALIKMLQYEPAMRSSVLETIEILFKNQISQKFTQSPIFIRSEINPNFVPQKFQIATFQLQSPQIFKPNNAQITQNQLIDKEKTNQMQLEGKPNEKSNQFQINQVKFQFNQQQQNGNFQGIFNTENLVIQQASQQSYFLKQEQQNQQQNKFKNQNFQRINQQKVNQNYTQNDFQQQHQEEPNSRRINLSRSLHSPAQINCGAPMTEIHGVQQQDQFAQKQQGQADSANNPNLIQDSKKNFDITFNQYQTALQNQVLQQQQFKQDNIQSINDQLNEIKQELQKKNKEQTEMKIQMERMQQQIEAQQGNQNQHQIDQQQEHLSFDDQISSMMLRQFVQVYNSKIEFLLTKEIKSKNLKQQQQQEIKSMLDLIEKFYQNLQSFNQ